MAKENIKGRNVALYLEKPAGSGTFVRYACADSVSLSVNTEEVEVTADCDDLEDETSVSFKDYEDGDIDWSGSISGNVRRITGTDAATNLSAEEIMDMQLSGTKLKLRFSLGTTEGAARYDGMIFFTSNQLTGERASAATFSANFRGKGKLTKSLV